VRLTLSPSLSAPAVLRSAGAAKEPLRLSTHAHCLSLPQSRGTSEPLVRGYLVDMLTVESSILERSLAACVSGNNMTGNRK